MRSLLSSHGAAQEQGVHSILQKVVFGLVKRQYDESLVCVEVLVGEERVQERPCPITGGCDIRVVAVVGHVGGNEHPLGQCVGRKVAVEQGKVLGLGEAVRIPGHRVIAHERVVLADVVVGARLLVHIVALKARVRHIFLVQAPADVSKLEQVDNRLDISTDAGRVVEKDAMSAGACCSDIVWLRRVRNGEVLVEYDTFCC